MKVLYAASEAVPFCKTGGLADVAGNRILKRMQPGSRGGGGGDRGDPAPL